MASTAQIISVLIADDRKEFQQLAAACLEDDPHITIVGFAETGEAVIEQTVRWRVDLVVLDMWLSGMDGLTALRHIKKFPSAPRVIVVHLYDDPACRLAAQKSGADGFVPKTDFPTTLLQAVLGQFHITVEQARTRELKGVPVRKHRSIEGLTRS